MYRRLILVAVLISVFLCGVSWSPHANAITEEEYNKQTDWIWWQTYFGLRSKKWEQEWYQWWYLEWQKQVRPRLNLGVTPGAYQVAIDSTLSPGDTLTPQFIDVPADGVFNVTLWEIDPFDPGTDPVFDPNDVLAAFEDPNELSPPFVSSVSATVSIPDSGTVASVDYYMAFNPTFDGLNISGQHAYDLVHSLQPPGVYLGTATVATNYSLNVDLDDNLFGVETSIVAVPRDSLGDPLFQQGYETGQAIAAKVPEASSLALILLGAGCYVLMTKRS
jgi:hypothetical protein